MATHNRTTYRYEPDVVYPPGDTLQELLDELGLTQHELATRTDLSTKHINQLIKGAVALTPETALRLERALGTPAHVWNNLESAYQSHRARQAETERLHSDEARLDSFPIKELIKRGCIQKWNTRTDQLRELFNFLGVANASALDVLLERPAAFRSSAAFASDIPAVTSWLRIGELRAQQIRCEPYDKNALVRLLPDLRALTLEAESAVWLPELIHRCSTVGVAVVAEPELPGTRINGATRWMTPDKVLVQISGRHKTDDIVWFTLFHELGHLLKGHSKKAIFINEGEAHQGDEAEADDFARNVLIPPSESHNLDRLRTDRDVVEFADFVGVSPGIVVGRLQHDGTWPRNRGNKLKKKVDFTR